MQVPPDDGALEELLRERRFGPPDPDAVTPWDFARRWPDTIVRERVWPIVSRLLVDDDALVRARAVELVRMWSEGANLTTPRLLDVATRHSDLYGEHAPEGVTLRYEIAFALSDRADETHGPRIAALLREMSRQGEIGGGAASVLGRYAPSLLGELPARGLFMTTPATSDIDENFLAFLVDVLGSEPVDRGSKPALPDLSGRPTHTASSADEVTTTTWQVASGSCTFAVEWTNVFFPGDVNEPAREAEYVQVVGARGERFAAVRLHARVGDRGISIAIDASPDETERILAACRRTFEQPR
jgi:hypothetical protein